jgi:hypothetical protein
MPTIDSASESALRLLMKTQALIDAQSERPMIGEQGFKHAESIRESLREIPNCDPKSNPRGNEDTAWPGTLHLYLRGLATTVTEAVG